VGGYGTFDLNGRSLGSGGLSGAGLYFEGEGGVLIISGMLRASNFSLLKSFL